MPARFPEAFRRAAGRRSQKDNCAASGSRPFARPILRSQHACWRARSRGSTRMRANRKIRGSSPRTPPAPASPGRLACSRAPRRPARPRTSPPALSIRAPSEFTEECVENPGADFSVQPRSHQRSGALDSHGRRDRPQLLLRGAFGGNQLSARGLADLFHFHESRNTQAFGFGSCVSPRCCAHFRDFLVQPRNLRLDFAQFAIRLGLRRGRFGDACSDGLRVSAEKRPAVLRNQIPDPAKDKNEIEPSENESAGGRGLIFAALGSQHGKRREEENQESARKDRLCAPPGLHRTSTRRVPPGPEDPPARMFSAISPASTTLDCSSDARAASTSAASAFFAACNSCCAAKRAALTAAWRSSSTFRRAASCSTKISPRTFRSASLYARSFSCTATRLASASCSAPAARLWRSERTRSMGPKKLQRKNK